MPSRASLLLVLLYPSIALSDVPQSIIGTWHFHGARAMCMEADPEHPNCPPAQDLCAAAASNFPAELELTFTESTVETDGKTIPYKVIGGNSGLVIVESTIDTGQVFVTNVRLVEGGIAVQSLDCRAHREQCERSHKEARKQMSERIAKERERAGEFDLRTFEKGPVVLEDAVDGFVSPDFNTPPVWIYYKSADEKPCERNLESLPYHQPTPVFKPDAGVGESGQP